MPVADGGEGTVEALVAAAHGRFMTLEVRGPLGDPVIAQLGVIDAQNTAVVELAAASGLPLVPPERRDPRVTTSYGFGQLLLAAKEEGVTRIIAGIGGSATNDAGAGMAQALGFRLLDAAGRDLPPGGAALASLRRIDGSQADPRWRDIKVDVACDVTNPLTGPEGASAVYGPQKGATPAMVEELDAALGHFAEVVRRDLRVEVEQLPGAGAAGGAGAGLVAFLGARLTRGAPLVVEAAGLDDALRDAQAAITGEGRVDRQTAYGKGPAEVIKRARAARVAAVVIAGSLGEGWEALDVPVITLGEGRVSAEELMRNPEPWLEEAAGRAVGEVIA